MRFNVIKKLENLIEFVCSLPGILSHSALLRFTRFLRHTTVSMASRLFVEDQKHRVGILTDLGHAFDGLRDVLKSLDAVIIESNYDAEMLENGPYPEHLKLRISGDGGHLSNKDSAMLLKQTKTDRLQWACLCHLSEENNEPARAREIHREILGDDFPVHVASRYDVSELLELQ